MPKCYTIFAQKYFSPNLGASPAPISYAYGYGTNNRN